MSQDKKMLTAALAYAARGWPVFPCKGGHGEVRADGKADKGPLTPNSFLDATTDPEKVTRMWQRHPGANIGLEPGAVQMMTLDDDPGFKEEDLIDHVGPVPETNLRVRTPRGGLHRHFGLLDGEVIAPSSDKLAKHCDVRSFHSYVLLPPSSTIDGSYTWESEGQPAFRTDKMAEVATKAVEKHKDRDNWIIEPDLPENIKLATRWLLTEARIAVTGEAGDHWTFATAAHCKGFGISEVKTLDLMWENWNSRCDPPWEFDELTVKVRNGHFYNQNPPGKLTPAYKIAVLGFAPREQQSEIGWSATAGPFRFVDGPGLRTIRPPEWLIPGCLPEDAYGMLVGASGAYKTFVALDMALTLATGGGALVAGEWDGLWDAPKRPGPVLFVAGEGRANIRKRAEAWMLHHFGHTEVPEEFVLADPVPHVRGGDESANLLMSGALLKHPDGYRAVFLDTVARAMQGTNTSSDENATAFTHLCDLLRRGLDASVLALHHTGHDNEDRARGSSAFLGDPDVILILTKEAELKARLKMAKQKDAEVWDEARWVNLKLMDLPEGLDSLVALKGAAPRKAAPGQTGEAALAVVSRFLMDFLKEHPSQEFTKSALAGMLPYHVIGGDEDGEGGERVGRKERSLKSDLDKIRDPDSMHPNARALYDPAKSRWRYSPV